MRNEAREMRDRLSRVAINNNEVLALAASAQWIVLAKWVRGIIFPHQYASKVWMTLEADAEHVIHLALRPFGASPQVARALQFECWINLDA